MLFVGVVDEMIWVVAICWMMGVGGGGISAFYLLFARLCLRSSFSVLFLLFLWSVQK